MMREEARRQVSVARSLDCLPLRPICTWQESLTSGEESREKERWDIYGGGSGAGVLRNLESPEEFTERHRHNGDRERRQIPSKSLQRPLVSPLRSLRTNPKATTTLCDQFSPADLGTPALLLPRSSAYKHPQNRSEGSGFCDCYRAESDFDTFATRL